MKPVAGLAGVAMTDPIRQNQEIARGIQRLTCAEQHASKLRAEKLPPIAGRAVQNQHRIPYDPLCIALGSAQGAVMDAQFGQDLPGAKLEVFQYTIAFCRWRSI